MSSQHELNVEAEMCQLLDAFPACNLEMIIDKIPDKDYQSMSQALGEAAKNARVNDNEHCARVLELIGAICSMTLLPKNRNAPFIPTIEFERQHTTTSESFTEAEIIFLNEIVDLINDPMLRARVADLVWVQNKSLGIENALTAIDQLQADSASSQQLVQQWRCVLAACH